MTTATTFLPQQTPDMASALNAAYAQLMQFLGTKPDTDKLLAEMVRLAGGALRASAAGMFITENIDKPELILEHNLGPIGLLMENNPIHGLNMAARRCAREAKPLIVPPFFVDTDNNDTPVNPSPYELLFVPMKLYTKIAMVLVMAVPSPPESNDATLHRTYLNFLAKMLAAAEANLTERHLTLIEKDRGTHAKLVNFAQQVHKHLFMNQVAIDIANLTRDTIGADRVTVELYPKLRKKIMAVSNVDVPNKRAAVIQTNRLIFDYVRDRQVPVCIDRSAAKDLASDVMLQDAATAYFAASEFDAFLAAPIKQDDSVLGVVLAEFSTSEKAQAQSMTLSDLSRVATTSVTNAIEYESIPLRKPLYWISQLWRKPTASKKALVASIAGVLLLAFVILCVVPFNFAIKADCQVRPRAQLVVDSPMEGRIIDVLVRPGETVYPKPTAERPNPNARPLMVFDTTELIAQRASLTAKMGELHVQLKDAEKRGDMSKISAAQAQIKQAQGDMQLVELQIEKATVWSPIEGKVLTDNLAQRKWATVRKSEPLLEVASFQDFELVVDVPESEVATVRNALANAAQRAAQDGQGKGGIDIEYILYPWPNDRYSVTAKGVATLLPASMQSKNANVFRLQVQLDPKSLPPDIALSGVTGRAKINVGDKPLFTQWFRGANRLLKMTAFF